jgi:hypothetical protein
MAKLVLPTYNPELEPEQVGMVLEQQFAGKYEVEPSSSRWIDYKVYPSGWKGATVKLKQDPERDQTVILVRGRVPSIWARLALVAIVWLPLVYMDTAGSRTVVQDVVDAVESSPELGGKGSAPPPPPPPPPMP